MTTTDFYGKDSYIYYVSGEIMGSFFEDHVDVPRSIRPVISLKK